MVARLGAGAALAIWLGSEGYRDIGAKVRDIPARPAAIRRMRDRPVLRGYWTKFGASCG